MKVYVVTRIVDREYCGFEIEKAFATEAQAQAYIDTVGQEYWTHWSGEEYETYQIEEVEFEG